MAEPQATADDTAKPAPGQGYWAIVRRQFFKQKRAVASLVFVVLFVAIAVLAPLLANDRPIIAKYKGHLSFPAFTTYLDSDAYPIPSFVTNALHRLPLFAPVWRELGDQNWKEALAASFLPAGVDNAHALPHWMSGDDGWALMPLVPYGFKENHPRYAKHKPGAPALEGQGHWLGTDEMGRDVTARLIYGTIVAMSVGVLSVSLYVLLGVIIGSIAGYFGGWVDILISRVIEVVICFPTLFLILAVLAIVREPSIYWVVILLGLIRWTGPARLIRGEFFKARGADYVIAARGLGLPTRRIIFRHLVPNCISPVLVTASFGVAGAILIESSLSFLGIGVAPPMPSWGELGSEGRQFISQGLYHLILYPGIATFVTVTAFNLLGEGIRDAMDPRLRD